MSCLMMTLIWLHNNYGGDYDKLLQNKSMHNHKTLCVQCIMKGILLFCTISEKTGEITSHNAVFLNAAVCAGVSSFIGEER